MNTGLAASSQCCTSIVGDLKSLPFTDTSLSKLKEENKAIGVIKPNQIYEHGEPGGEFLSGQLHLHCLLLFLKFHLELHEVYQ